MAKNEKNVLIGKRIKEERTRKGLTQKELSEILECTTQNVSNIECGKTGLKPRNARILAEVFKTEIGYFLGECDYRNINEKTFQIIREEVQKHDALWSLLKLYGYDLHIHKNVLDATERILYDSANETDDITFLNEIKSNDTLLCVEDANKEIKFIRESDLNSLIADFITLFQTRLCSYEDIKSRK